MHTNYVTAAILAEEYIRERREEVRFEALAREAEAARGRSRGLGIVGWIGRALAFQSKSASRTASSQRA